MLGEASQVSKRRKALLLNEKEQFTFDFGGSATEPTETDTGASPEVAYTAPPEELSKETAQPLDAEEVQKCFENALARAEGVLIGQSLDEAVAQFQNALRRYGETAIRQDKAKRRGAAVKQRTDRLGVKNRASALKGRDSGANNSRRSKKG